MSHPVVARMLHSQTQHKRPHDAGVSAREKPETNEMDISRGMNKLSCLMRVPGFGMDLVSTTLPIECIVVGPRMWIVRALRYTKLGHCCRCRNGGHLKCIGDKHSKRDKSTYRWPVKRNSASHVMDINSRNRPVSIQVLS